ncbi:hypothetical protein Ancab_005553 [Ancistrocladus abbreviatus]
MEGSLGKSLLVPSVQELAKETLTINTIPPRYIQHVHPPLPSESGLADLQLPTISMEALVSGNPQELQKLHAASQHWGFFQLVEHGVSSLLVEKIKRETKEFFNLPVEEKRKYWQSPEDVEGFGQAFVQSEEQKLDWADMFYLVTLPKHLRKPHLLPALPLPFRDALENYSTELENLARKILNCMETALKIDSDDHLTEMFGEGKQSMRINYYPPCPEPDKVIGLTPHSDADGLTILLQLNEMDGLQIRKDGMWIPVNPMPNAFIVNIGDMLEIMTNGTYRSIEHRAIVNPKKERLSIATFYFPSLDREIAPASIFITPQNPARFRSIIVANYLKGRFNRVLDGKSHLDTLRIEEN